MDENVNRYRIGIRSKKWWWCIWSFLLDVSIVNAWTCMRAAGADLTQLQFRREIVQTYLTRSANLPRGGGRVPSSRFSETGNRVSDTIRYDGVRHLLVETEEGVRRRCAYEQCSSRARTQCVKCDVGLCVSCNYAFHTQQ